VTTLERLQAPELDERLAAISEVATREHPAPEELQALGTCLGGERKVIQRRAAEAFVALHQRGVAVADTLLAALRAAAPQQRWGAAYALSLLGAAPPQSLPVLLECLGVNDGDVRWAAASILVHMQPTPELVTALRELLAAGNAAQRKMAAYCLRDLDARSPAVVPALFVALNDAEPTVRMAAMSSLAHLCGDRAQLAPRVVALLEDADAGVRRAAAVVLGTLGERSAPVLATLREAAASADPSLQRAAVRSLRLLGA
jgi:HEAT repeat protein